MTFKASGLGFLGKRLGNQVCACLHTRPRGSESSARGVGARMSCRKLSHETRSLLSILPTGKPLVSARFPFPVRPLPPRHPEAVARVEARSCPHLPARNTLPLPRPGQSPPILPSLLAAGKEGERKRPSPRVWPQRKVGVSPPSGGISGAKLCIQTHQEPEAGRPGAPHGCILIRPHASLTGDCPLFAEGSPKAGSLAVAPLYPEHQPCSARSRPSVSGCRVKTRACD